MLLDVGSQGPEDFQDEQLFDPTLDPMWETQVALEQGMTREGARRVQEAVTKAITKGQRTRLKPYQDLIQAWLPPIADDIKNWVAQTRREQARRGGPSPVALEPLSEVDPYVASLLTLRAILNHVATRHQEVTNLAITIGGTVEHELQVRLWERKEPDLYHAQQNTLRRQKADPTHTSRVNIHAFNSLLSQGKFGFGWTAWDTNKKLHVGTALINAVIRATGWFEVKASPDGSTNRKGVPPTVLLLKEGMESWIADRLGKLEECSPALKPTVIKPKRWTGMGDGGYWTPYVKGPDLIRFHAHQIDQRENAREEYNALDMPKVYQALHFLQETPWRINKRVHAVVNEALKRNLVIANMPDYRGRELPIKPVDIETNPEAAQRWRKEASVVKAYNKGLVSSRFAFDRTMLVAHEYQAFERFYFPHMLDFRGRMYPIPVGLQPQGNDLSRGLLELAEGKPVTQENQGDAWLAINLASAWGKDKVSFDDRIAWVHANSALWRRIARDPLGCRDDWVHSADKPWQALGAILDWVGFLDRGFGYISHAAVAVDGTCNGIQHLSAMMRDAEVGSRVNLVPGDKPRDIYQFVADGLLPTLERIKEQRGEPGELAAYWLGFKVDGKLPRGLVKRQVMVLPYSATREAFFKYAKLWLDEFDPTDDATDWSLRYKRLSFFVTHLWDAVMAQVPRAMEVMKWLKDCASQSAVGNQPVYWMTPDGFVVRHFYGKMATRQIRVKLDASEFQLRLYEPTKDLDKQRQLLGISPNFVHSFDACAARGCINKAAEGGEVTAFASIHDSFGTHAADMWKLYGYLREAFVETHSQSVLLTFRKACMGVMVAEMVGRGVDPLKAFEEAHEKLPPLPELGDLELEGVLESDYFFA